MTGSPFVDGADERSMGISAPGEALINTNLVLTNFLFDACRNLAVNAPSAQLPGKFTTAKNTLPSGPYAKTLFTIVSQLYPQ